MQQKHIINSILLLVIVTKLGVSFSRVPEQLTDLSALNDIWLHSQYNLGTDYEFLGNMSDEDLRTLAALEYIRGKDPSRINFEDPPLTKYIFGLSYLVSGKLIYMQFLASIGVLLLAYALARRLSLTPTISLIPSLLLVFDPLFIEKATTVNLDLMQLLFMLISLLFLLQTSYKLTKLLILGVAIGAVMASKVVFTGLLFLVFVLMVLMFKRRPGFYKEILWVVASSLSVYLISYAVFFVYHSPLDFVSLHIRLVRLYRSYLPEYPWFEIWRILLLGQWKTWFATPAIQPVSQFWIVWPLSTLVTLSLFFKEEFRRLPLKSPQILLGWALIYLAFQSTHVVFPRYILAILPLLYLLAVFHLSSLVTEGGRFLLKWR